MNPEEPVHRFEHEAMHTTFSLRLADCDRETARHAAADFFRRLDCLEDHLSRFREASDISRINALAPGESLRVSEACHACLLQAAEAHVLTGGLFDVTIGASIRRFKEQGETGGIAEKGRLLIDPEQAAVACLEEGREIDLGGIAKGFALDWLAPVLDEWRIPSSLLAAGRSTLLARGSRSWPVHTAAENSRLLCQRALSVSGDAMQGVHVLHPDSSVLKQHISAAGRVWLAHKSAAMADALSTAALLVGLNELPDKVETWNASLLACSPKC